MAKTPTRTTERKKMPFFLGYFVVSSVHQIVSLKGAQTNGS